MPPKPTAHDPVLGPLTDDLLTPDVRVWQRSHGHRVSVTQGDLRAPPVRARLGADFDLVTGTPPYFPADSARAARDDQRARARIETRGGVEAYIEAGVPLLAPAGRLVLCGDARAQARVADAAAQAHAHIVATTVVVPRAERPPLFSVTDESPRHSTMVLRDEHGRSTRDADALRTFSGFPSLFDAAS